MMPYAAAPRKLRQEDTDIEASLGYISMLLFQDKQTYKTKQTKAKTKPNKKSRTENKNKNNTKQINEQMSYQAMKRHRRFRVLVD